MKKLNQILQSKLFYILLFIVLGIYIFFNIFIIKRSSKYNINENTLQGKISFYKIDGDKLSITLEGKEKVIVNYYMKSESEKDYFENNLRISSLIYLTGNFNEPTNNTVPNTFNYKKYLYYQKIYMLFDATSIKILKNGFSIKNIFIKRLNEFERKDYLYAFVLGDKSYLDMTNYQINGVSHLFAISGMHISFLVSFLEKRLRIKSNILISIFLWLYCYLVSFTVGVLRVVIFKTIKSIFNKVNIKINNISVLLLTAVLMLFLNPFYIYNYGFLYSFIISFSMMLFEIKGSYLISLLKISMISFLFSLPITILLNYQINILAIFNNLFFVPLVTFINFPLSLITFIIPLLEPLLNLSLAILDYINKILPVINVVVPKMHFIVVLMYYISLYMATKLKLRIATVLLIVLLIFSKYRYIFNNETNIYFVDIGQGDASVIVYPRHKKVIMIDCGGKLSYEKDDWQIKTKEQEFSYNLQIFLKSLGISKIDMFVSSHGDFDHMGEAINLVENFKVEKVIFNCGEFNDLEQELIRTLDKKKIPYYSCIKELNIDKNKLYFLQTNLYDNENDNSNVIYTELNGYKFMFMGDASITTEKEILKEYNLPYVDVLKVGHHGSKTSSGKEFINEINPKYFIISVGKNNRYGHPNKEVLENLNNSKIYRTDQDGSIMFKIKNDKLQVEICSP